jgi:hypothetical protein
LYLELAPEYVRRQILLVACLLGDALAVLIKKNDAPQQCVTDFRPPWRHCLGYLGASPLLAQELEQFLINLVFKRGAKSVRSARIDF